MQQLKLDKVSKLTPQPMMANVLVNCLFCAKGENQIYHRQYEQIIIIVKLGLYNQSAAKTLKELAKFHKCQYQHCGHSSVNPKA